jgi:hypothetical protein
MSCTVEVKDKSKEFPTIVNASNYTALKRDRVLYSQYRLNHDTNICFGNVNSIYNSYQLRRNVTRGCLWNTRTCLKLCLNDKNN